MSNKSTPKITVSIVGSTQRTVLCAEALHADDRFEVIWVLTPAPRAIGRKQEIKANPLATWAEKQQIESVIIDTKITQESQDLILNNHAVPDILLVVDFGYIIPQWLLDLPKYAPLNIHPSQLPRWRGSSPGQFVLLYGETQSAITLMKINTHLDQGDIIAQVPFTVEPNWNHDQYYQHSFAKIVPTLATMIAEFVSGSRQPISQPTNSPTPIARRLTRDDGYIAWEVLEAALTGSTRITLDSIKLTGLLRDAANSHADIATLVEHACRGFSPWPGLWTEVHTEKGKKRLKILECKLVSQANPHIQLVRVQLEGKQPTNWQDVKNTIL